MGAIDRTERLGRRAAGLEWWYVCAATYAYSSCVCSLWHMCGCRAQRAERGESAERLLTVLSEALGSQGPASAV